MKKKFINQQKNIIDILNIEKKYRYEYLFINYHLKILHNSQTSYDCDKCFQINLFFSLDFK